MLATRYRFPSCSSHLLPSPPPHPISLSSLSRVSCSVYTVHLYKIACNILATNPLCLASPDLSLSVDKTNALHVYRLFLSALALQGLLSSSPSLLLCSSYFFTHTSCILTLADNGSVFYQNNHMERNFHRKYNIEFFKYQLLCFFMVNSIWLFYNYCFCIRY